MSDEPIRVLFLCTGNSCRSQMAERLLNHLGKGRVHAFSAGTEPKPVHELAVRSMREIDLDISASQSKSADAFAGQRFDYVISLCDKAKETCPSLEGVREHIHWSFEDPAEESGDEARRMRAFARVREGIRQRLNLFLLTKKVGER